MKCISCKSEKLVHGKMEGIVVSPITELTKSIGRGAYGLTACTCQDCGSINEFCLSESSLEILRDMNQGGNRRERQLNEGKIMECVHCGNNELIEGTLEGTYFKPSKEFKRGLLAKSVHHPRVIVCLSCGRILRMSLNIEELRDVTRTNRQ